MSKFKVGELVKVTTGFSTVLVGDVLSITAADDDIIPDGCVLAKDSDGAIWCVLTSKIKKITTKSMPLGYGGWLMDYTNDPTEIRSELKKCTCGAEKTGSNHHYDWCDLRITEKPKESEKKEDCGDCEGDCDSCDDWKDAFKKYMP